MVFHYTIRGGPCRNAHSHVTLTSDEITCFVGRDKHENEFLIQYGWPGDVWFHVDGLSSAHVYFRVMDHNYSSIPMDDLPLASIQDMMQIVKHNSIQGCKLASCKIVWTPHSNLKKTAEMDAGTVTYHNTKLCRYGRCDKDRSRIKELEKTKRERHNVNYFEEMKANERRIIERRKQERQQQRQQAELYDPMRDDLLNEKRKAGRQGDEKSGLDTGLAALEDLAFEMRPQPHPAAEGSSDPGAPQDSPISSFVWMRESENRALEESCEAIRFLRARGYTHEEANAPVVKNVSSPVDALVKLWRMNDISPDCEITATPEEANELQREEAEVLRAIFGEDDDGVHFSQDDTKLDAILPISAYEPPERYGLPPPLLLEVYVDNGAASLYPYEPPVLALVGGGLPDRWIKELTNRLRSHARERCREEPGEPQIFNLVTFVGEEIEAVLTMEAEELEALRQQQVATAKAEQEARKKAIEAQRREENASQAKHGPNYTTEAERRAYAQEIIAATPGAKGGSTTAAKTPSTATRYNTGVSDQKLIEDLFS